MRRGEELRAVLGEADGLDLRGDPEPLQQRQIRGQQRLANVEAGMMGLLEQHDAMAGLRQQGRGGRSRRAAPDDDDVSLGVARGHLAVTAMSTCSRAGSR